MKTYAVECLDRNTGRQQVRTYRGIDPKDARDQAGAEGFITGDVNEWRPPPAPAAAHDNATDAETVRVKGLFQEISAAVFRGGLTLAIVILGAWGLVAAAQIPPSLQPISAAIALVVVLMTAWMADFFAALLRRDH